MLKVINAIKLDLYVDQGDTYYKEFTLSDGILPVILTGYNFEFEIKDYMGSKSLPIVFSVTSPIPILGAITITAGKLETDLLYRSRYVYRLQASSLIETVTLMHGQMVISNF
jgi:hypothetical protein